MNSLRGIASFPVSRRFFSTTAAIFQGKGDGKRGRPKKQVQVDNVDSYAKPKIRADPKNDFAFKFLFRNHTNILMEFLNDVLLLDSKITKVEFNNTEIIPAFENHKLSKLDLLCTLNDKSLIIVEIQVSHQIDYTDRVLHYASRIYSSQVCRSLPYGIAKNLTVLSVCDFVVFKQKDMREEYLSHHGITNLRTNSVTHPQLHFVYLELPKFPINQLENPVDFWSFFFSQAHLLEQEKIDALKLPDKKPILVEAIKCMEYYSWPLELQKEYDDAEKERLELNQTKNEGIAIGKKIGFQEGIEKGREEILNLPYEEYVALKNRDPK